ncbi:hypothetical protein KOW79_004924 [Hemibagrus wyckioides]|uniref:Uncharacterized protein n=1 Tax=Hemibagrus wyckioides TaxID=337641 RepID=A0A9D3NXY5_9TELE|nr:hypothetical protein KOW79_004924 [Hemibagrus wyckioides]
MRDVMGYKAWATISGHARIFQTNQIRPLGVHPPEHDAIWFPGLWAFLYAVQPIRMDVSLHAARSRQDPRPLLIKHGVRSTLERRLGPREQRRFERRTQAAFSSSIQWRSTTRSLMSLERGRLQ